MRLFEVKFQTDDISEGAKKGAMMFVEHWYVAENVLQVIKGINLDLIDESMEFVSLREALPMVQVLAKEDAP